MNLVDPIAKLFGDWLSTINICSIIVRLFLAVACSGVIGAERATKRHAAGFRTYILVCLGATIVMLTNQFLYETFGTGDVGRMGAQVISGIGFLGVGTIFITSKNRIKGLTTAAGLWACACIGLSIGVGFYTLGILGTVVMAISLSLFPKIEHFFTKRSRYLGLHVELYSRTSVKDLIEYLREIKINVILITYNPAYANTGLSVYTVEIENRIMKNDELIETINQFDYIHYVEIIQ